MVETIRLTAAQAAVKYIASQKNEAGETFIAGVWAIFGHGNVAGLGEALYGVRETLPTWRGHNEQTMAHAAIAFAKQSKRSRAMAVTTSIGPGATNLVTAAALAHVNRLPVLLMPGDVFANRGPDPVLQQIEDFHDGALTLRLLGEGDGRVGHRLLVVAAPCRQRLAHAVKRLAQTRDVAVTEDGPDTRDEGLPRLVLLRGDVFHRSLRGGQPDRLAHVSLPEAKRTTQFCNRLQKSSTAFFATPLVLHNLPV